MTDKKSLEFLERIAGFKIRTKELHWAAKTTDEHDFCDDVSDFLNDMEDPVSEEVQAIFGKVNPGDIKVIYPKAMTSKELVAELLTCLQEYYQYTDKKLEMVGLNSQIKSYISNTDIFEYQVDMAVVNEHKKGRNIIVTEEQVKRVAGKRMEDKINEGAGIDVTGVYEIGRNSVRIDETNSMITVKDNHRNILFEQQGENIRNILNLMKTQGSLMEDRGGFKTVLAEWLRKQQII